MKTEGLTSGNYPNLNLNSTNAIKADFRPECTKIEVTTEGKTTGHIGIIQNFCDAILSGTELIAPVMMEYTGWRFQTPYICRQV